MKIKLYDIGVDTLSPGFCALDIDARCYGIYDALEYIKQQMQLNSPTGQKVDAIFSCARILFR